MSLKALVKVLKNGVIWNNWTYALCFSNVIFFSLTLLYQLYLIFLKRPLPAPELLTLVEERYGYLNSHAAHAATIGYMLYLSIYILSTTLLLDSSYLPSPSVSYSSRLYSIIQFSFVILYFLIVSLALLTVKVYFFCQLVKAS